MRKLIACVVTALPLAVLAQPTPLAARTQAEIGHLFDYIAQSHCRFSRNGDWHGMQEARSHVGMKYDYLRERGKIGSAEDFIDQAASRSSLSGREYQVQCPGAGPLPSGAWLRSELERFRLSSGKG